MQKYQKLEYSRVKNINIHTHPFSCMCVLLHTHSFSGFKRKVKRLKEEPPSISARTILNFISFKYYGFM